MSEKHDPEKGPDAQRDADSVPDEPSPFKLSSMVPGGSGPGRAGPKREPSPPAEPPEEIDAGVQELQARPADLTPPSHAEPPKTIISDRVPEWPTWSDGGLPPLIIYGPTPTRRSAGAGQTSAETPAPSEPPASEPPASESPAYEARADEPPPADVPTFETPAAEATPAEPDFIAPPEPPPLDESIPSLDESIPSIEESASVEAYEEVAPEPEADIEDAGVPFGQSERVIPTMPVDSTVPARSSELDEIFDSIDDIAARSSDSAEDASDAEVSDSGAEGFGLTNEPQVPATIMGEVPDLSQLQVDQSDYADSPPPADEAVAGGGDSGGVEPLFEMSASEEPVAEPADVEPSVDELPAAADADLPSDVEPELAVSESDLLEAGEAAPVEPVMTSDSEPSPVELAAIPVEPPGALPVAAVAGSVATAGVAAAARLSGAPASGGAVPTHGYPGDASHGQTAAEFFAHAHEDVEQRRGLLSHGLLTKLSGLGGLLAGAVALSLLLLACAGFGTTTSENIPFARWVMLRTAIWVGPLAVFFAIGAIFWKSWWPSALLAAIIAIAAGGGWYALEQYHEKAAGWNLLSISPWLTYVGLGGLALAILGGLIEHRRMREETHVLAAVFTNLIVVGTSGVLWLLWLGTPLLPK